MLNQIAHTLPMKKYIFLYTRKKITPKLQQTKTSTHNDHKSGNVIFFSCCVSSLTTARQIVLWLSVPQIVLFRIYCYSLEATRNGETNY